VRNNLGVRDPTNWIFNLNIANVMNMTPMNADELESGGNEDDKLYQELTNDTMLEKIILFVVSYFCVGTEIRFVAAK
jgi:hypothetical protein